jgi:plastocyanin
MKMRALYSFSCAAFAALVGAAGLAGCFSEHVAFTPPTGEELCTGPQPANVVRIVDFAFTPNQLSVPAGTTVTWVNCSSTATQHTSSSDTNLWGSGLIPQYVTFERTFPAAGAFPYHCGPHPFMVARVTVS